MVHDKKRSGDPDYDDKVPLNEQLGETVTGPDGETILITESNGPVGPDGAHRNLDVPADEGDNRPAPGGVAKESSTVQTYTREDVTGGSGKSAGKTESRTDSKTNR